MKHELINCVKAKKSMIFSPFFSNISRLFMNVFLPDWQEAPLCEKWLVEPFF